MSCHLRVGDFEFSPEDVERAVRDKGLLSIEVEFSLKCNFHCRYCYLQGHPGGDGGLSASEGQSVISQARELGARKIIASGGEPMLYPHILEMLTFGREQGLQVEIFTNGSRIDRRTADRLFELGVRVVLKRNSFVPEVQDELAGLKGANRVIETAYRNLRAAGYPSGERILGISSVICRQNRAEIPRLWEWIRGEGLVPYLEVITPHDGIPNWDQLTLEPQEYQRMFEQLAAWDREHGGLNWDPQPPLVGNRCLRHLFSCLVDAEARVLPCAGVRIPVGNLREHSLRETLDDSEVIQNLRDFRHTISGPCASCARSESCYGCRGAAYTETGDYLASDPRCWHNRDRQHEIARMPVPVASFIPHGDPMRLVDTLHSVGERIATAGVTVRADMPFVDEDGVLSDAAFLEMIAQAAAAMGGFGKRGRGRGREAGLMLGTRNLEILGEARIGDQLSIEVFKSARLGEFGIVEGCVRRQADVLARGEIKVLQLDSREAS
jgi:radical SAM protein with 4Fe4S-binding SPASM domain